MRYVIAFIVVLGLAVGADIYLSEQCYQQVWC